MFFVLSKVFDVFLSPFTWVLLLAAAAVPWSRKAARAYRRRRVLGAVALGLAWLASNDKVSDELAGYAEARVGDTYDATKTYDVVVMLGGVVDAATTEDRFAFNDNVERMLTTFDLLRTDRARFAIISGGDAAPARPGLTEADVVADQLERWGVSHERLIRETKARNTRENAVLVAEIVKERGFSRVLLVTSAVHMARSADCFRAVGLAVDVLGVDHRHRGWAASWVLPRADALSRNTALTRELSGRWIYRLRGFGRGP
ncbi:MAG: YdcF family protein [Myxococcales bacterium]|nr:YdcF family protein [Myxococcales bacterium]